MSIQSHYSVWYLPSLPAAKEAKAIKTVTAIVSVQVMMQWGCNSYRSNVKLVTRYHGVRLLLAVGGKYCTH